MDGVITGSLELRQIQVFDCREHNGGSTDQWWGESAEKWKRDQEADGPYCKDGSEPDPG